MNAGIGGIPASGTIVNEMAEDMAIFQEILHWSKSSLLPWQQDALRRIWIQRELEEADVSELLTMAKSHRGASYTGPQPPEPMPLDDNHIAANVVCESAPSLKSMHSLRNVNAISSEQRLEFGVRGLTAIYGENAAGKSSYCRVLKKACRARSKGKTILPNVFAPQSDLLPPQAIFELVDQAGVSKTVTWTDGNPAPPAMSAFALFDADCVRLYVNDAGEVLYIPYGLDCFSKLAGLCTDIREEIQREINSSAPTPPIIDEIIGAGKILAQITHRTTPVEINTLAAFSEADEERLTHLTRIFADLTANDPLARARELRRKQQRVDNLRSELLARARAFSTMRVSELRVL
ncbi:MAG: ATP-binding protein, partial [candidate division Zixibacteria bacterium]|nr:ATP-binding protein [candidate division Zixibacteria bacterium]